MCPILQSQYSIDQITHFFKFYTLWSNISQHIYTLYLRKSISKITDDETIVNCYSRIRIFLDEDYKTLEKFTALGSIYLVHESIENVELYNFESACFDTIEGQ